MRKLDYFTRKRVSFMFFMVLLIGITYATVIFTEYNVAKGFTSIPKAFTRQLRIFTQIVPLSKNCPQFYSNCVIRFFDVGSMQPLWHRFMPFAVAILGAQTTRINVWLSVIARGIATIFRNIDVSA
jgi:phosphonate transport system permease protein